MTTKTEGRRLNSEVPFMNVSFLEDTIIQRFQLLILQKRGGSSCYDTMVTYDIRNQNFKILIIRN